MNDTNGYDDQAGRLWQQIKDEVRERLPETLHEVDSYDHGEVIIPSDASAGDSSRVDRAKRRDRVWRSEESFVKRVWQEVLAQPERGQKTILLFDIDEVLGSSKGRPDGTWGTALRPSAVPLLRSLKERGGRNGIISYRAAGGLNEQLGQKEQLRAIEPFLDRAFVSGSSGRNKSLLAGIKDGRETPHDLHAKVKPLLTGTFQDPDAFRTFRTEQGNPLSTMDIDKLLQLCGLSAGLAPGENLLVLDDRRYIDMLPEPVRGDQERSRENEDPYRPSVFGIRIKPEERAYF